MEILFLDSSANCCTSLLKNFLKRFGYFSGKGKKSHLRVRWKDSWKIPTTTYPQLDGDNSIKRGWK